MQAALARRVHGVEIISSVCAAGTEGADEDETAAGGINPASGLFFFSASWEQICMIANSTSKR